MDFDVEHRDPQSVGGQRVGVGVRQPGDDAFESQPAQDVAHLDSQVGLTEQGCHPGRQDGVGEPPTACTLARKAPTRAMTRGLPNRRAGAPTILDGGSCRPLKGWARKDTILAHPESTDHPCVDVTSAGVQLIEVLQPASHTQVAGIVDDPREQVKAEKSGDAESDLGLCGQVKAFLRERVGRVLEWLAEVGEEVLEVVGGAVVAFDFAAPASGGGVGGEGLLDSSPRAQAGCVGRCGDEFRAGRVEVAFARAFLWEA